MKIEKKEEITCFVVCGSVQYGDDGGRVGEKPSTPCNPKEVKRVQGK